MEEGPSYTFDVFRLEPPPGGLRRGDVRIALWLRPLAMLRYLLAHAGRLVTKAELRQLVFVSGDVGMGKTTVGDRFLAQCATRRARAPWAGHQDRPGGPPCRAICG